MSLFRTGWQANTRPEIRFTSPDGAVFRALWISNDRNFEKKLGVFDIPGIDGSLTQDKGSKSTAYTLTAYFDGADHQDTAEDFFQSLNSQRGPWTVLHPTKGSLRLQLVSVTEAVNPTEDGNYTQFSTEWLEPAILDSPVSADEVSRLSLSKITSTIGAAINQLQQLRSDLYSAVQAGVNVANQALNATSGIMQEIAATNAIITDAWESARAVYITARSEYLLDPTDPSDIGQALIDFVTIPSGVNDEFETRATRYSELITALEGGAPLSNTSEDFNAALFYELSYVASMIAVAQIILTSNFRTRSSVLSAMDEITVLYSDAINQIESVQNNFVGLAIDLQYFSQSKTFTEIQGLFGLVIQFLLTQFFNLNAEKRFTIKTDRSPLEITVTEYGTLGDNEENYQLFIDSNNLTGDDILLLPAGREVVVYV